MCVCRLSHSLVVVGPSRQQCLTSGKRQTETGSIVRARKMELSAAGDRIFAAEAILKRRVRKVSHSRRRPACFDFPQMLAAVSTAPYERYSGPQAPGCLLASVQCRGGLVSVGCLCFAGQS